MKTPISHSSDPDLHKVPQALLRAAEKSEIVGRTNWYEVCYSMFNSEFE